MTSLPVSKRSLRCEENRCYPRSSSASNRSDASTVPLHARQRRRDRSSGSRSPVAVTTTALDLDKIESSNHHRAGAPPQEQLNRRVSSTEVQRWHWHLQIGSVTKHPRAFAQKILVRSKACECMRRAPDLNIGTCGVGFEIPCVVFTGLAGCYAAAQVHLVGWAIHGPSFVTRYTGYVSVRCGCQEGKNPQQK